MAKKTMFTTCREGGVVIAKQEPGISSQNKNKNKNKGQDKAQGKNKEEGNA